MLCSAVLCYAMQCYAFPLVFSLYWTLKKTTHCYSVRTSKIQKNGSSENSVVLRISGRTFEFLVERSNFWSNVWVSGRTFEISVECSETWKLKNWSLGPKIVLPECIVEATLMFWRRTLICRGQKQNILSKNGQKWRKTFFKIFRIFYKNHINHINTIWNAYEIIWKILVRVTLV